MAQAHSYQHSITILSEDEGPENPEELDHDSDDIQFVILGIVIGLGIAGLITYRRFKR
jgi:LPXTG-motif cell wall-anchored protein